MPIVFISLLAQFKTGVTKRMNFCYLVTSVISVQQFIFILVFIQFLVNHFYFYSVLVLSTFTHFRSYSVLVQAFTIILVLIQFSFLINQIYEMYCYSTVSIQLKILVFSFRKTRISKFFSRFRLPAVSIPQREKMRTTYASDAGADNKSNASGARLWYIA